MKGVRFYLEFETPAKKRSKEHAGNVFAADVKSKPRGTTGMRDGIGAVYHSSNSPVAGTAASRDFLRTRCKRISEAEARKIHPLLFQRLDQRQYLK